MKEFFASACLFLGMATVTTAQEFIPPFAAATGNVSADFAMNRTPSAAFFAPFWNTPSPPTLAVPRFAPSLPEPEPQSAQGDEDNFRYELGLAVAFVRFRSSPINASMAGPNTSVGYYVTKQLALEGTVTTAYGSEIFDREHTKYLFFGAGPKMVFGNGKLRPFVHANFGIVHMLPQTAGNSQKGFAAQLGGGAELHLNPIWSLRFGGDYVRAQVYPGGQNNIQVVVGVFHRFK
jgi:hypothetical protein